MRALQAMHTERNRQAGRAQLHSSISSPGFLCTLFSKMTMELTPILVQYASAAVVEESVAPASLVSDSCSRRGTRPMHVRDAVAPAPC
jgi:hypothetical protein